MSLPKIILVPTDFSTAAEAALDEALALATALGASVYLLHAYQLPITGVPDPVVLAEIDQRVLAWALGELDACIGRRKDRGVTIVPLLRQGDARQAALDVAEEISADLIVMGTHGRHGVARALIGSVAEAVVRTSRVPVLTVHAA
jgi:nucleotide-binding universal stress UspA family protein